VREGRAKQDKRSESSFVPLMEMYPILCVLNYSDRRND